MDVRLPAPAFMRSRKRRSSLTSAFAWQVTGGISRWLCSIRFPVIFWICVRGTRVSPSAEAAGDAARAEPPADAAAAVAASMSARVTLPHGPGALHRGKIDTRLRGHFLRERARGDPAGDRDIPFPDLTVAAARGNRGKIDPPLRGQTARCPALPPPSRGWRRPQPVEILELPPSPASRPRAGAEASAGAPCGMASPCFPIHPITTETGTVSPSFFTMPRRTPAASASSSIVDLSVSISAIGSPFWTLSPARFSQRMIVPSSMAMPVFGMMMLDATSVSSYFTRSRAAATTLSSVGTTFASSTGL